MHIQYRSRDGGRSCDKARQYIAREGEFVGCGDTVRWVKSLHMPVWAGDGSTAVYWQAAEGRHSRVNARTGILVEFALPKVLTVPDQDALALRMAELLSSMATEDASSGRLPVTLAIHEGYGRNPHVHALVSTSIADGLVRTVGTWFRRRTPKSPAAGGAQRSVYVTKRRWVHRVRQAWAALANAALELRGLPPALDHRSHAARGLTLEPQIHLGPRIAHMRAQGIDTSRGARHAEVERRNAELSELDARILQRREAVEDLVLSSALALQAERVWALKRDEDWCAMLEGHRLAGDAADLKIHATAIVMEADSKNIVALHEAYQAQTDVRRFAQAVGPDWEPVATRVGFWAIKSNQDSVVLLCSRYAATDGEDEGSLAAMIAAATTLPFKRPLMAVRDSHQEMAIEQLERLGLDWQVLRMKSPRLAPR